MCFSDDLTARRATITMETDTRARDSFTQNVPPNTKPSDQ